MLERILIAGHRYHRCGVMLGDFTSEHVVQFGLFDDAPPRKNRDRLMLLLDSLNQDGPAPVRFAGQDIPDRADGWKMKRQRFLPACATRPKADLKKCPQYVYGSILDHAKEYFLQIQVDELQ